MSPIPGRAPPLDHHDKGSRTRLRSFCSVALHLIHSIPCGSLGTTIFQTPDLFLENPLPNVPYHCSNVVSFTAVYTMASSVETMVEYSAWEPSKWEGIPEFAVKETLEILKKMAPTEYAQLEAEPAKKEELIAAAKEVASEEIKLAYEFKDEPEDIAAILRKHLPEDRYDQAANHPF